MKLDKITIEGFRCFGKKTILDVSNNMTVFIGANSSGKTALMNALMKVLSNNSNDRIIKKSDFHLPKESKPDEMEKNELHIELKFSFPELSVEGADLSAIPIFFRNLLVPELDGIPYIRICLSSFFEKSTNPEGSIETEINYYVCDEKLGRLEEKKSKALRRDLDSIRIIYIPALRDIEKEIKYVSGTLIQKMFNLVKWDEDIKAKITENSKNLNNVIKDNMQVQIIDSALATNWSNYNIDNRFHKSKIIFSDSEISEILKKIDIGFNPSVIERDFSVSEMGDGSKSTLYFSLIMSLIDAEKEIKRLGLNDNIELPVMTILISEEPENHIAPHMLGQLVDSICKVAEFENSQVIMSSHSPSIISKIDPLNIRILRNNSANFSSEVSRINIPTSELEQYKYSKDAIQKNPNIYFSKLVIVVEGDSEQYILPKFLIANNIDLDKQFITILSLNTRFVSPVWKLLIDLGIPYLTFVDLDGERSCGGYKKISYFYDELFKYKLIKDFQLNDGLYMFKDKEKVSMKTWLEVRDDTYLSWINDLENYGIYLSYPLDIDFLMLLSYKNEYINTLEDNQGPRVKGKGKVVDIEKLKPLIPEYISKIIDCTENVLKSDSGNGETYSEEEKMLFIWYNYFFLSEEKPKSHFMALNKIDNDSLLRCEPDVISRLIRRINELLVL